MFFGNIYIKEQLSVTASLEHENVLALTIRIEMFVFIVIRNGKINWKHRPYC